jgi:hypothetical protein
VDPGLCALLLEWHSGHFLHRLPTGYQTHGFVFPNIARNDGISRFTKTAKLHEFRARNVIGAGVVTPWGDVKVYETSFVHLFWVNNGGVHHWRDAS